MENWTTDVEEIKCQNQLKDKYKDELESKRYYLLKNVNGKIFGFQHSRHGNGKHLTVLDKRKNKGN